MSSILCAISIISFTKMRIAVLAAAFWCASSITHWRVRCLQFFDILYTIRSLSPVIHKGNHADTYLYAALESIASGARRMD